MRGSRGDYAVFCVAGIVTALAYLWLPDVALLVVGIVVAVLAGAALIAGARRGLGWRQHQALTRELWVTASRIPPGRVLVDPGTGDLVSVERKRGWLILVIASPPPSLPESGLPESGQTESGLPAGAASAQPLGAGQATGAIRYVIGRWGAPVRPPVRRRPAGDADADLRADAAEVSTAELAKLVDQILRTAVLGVVG